MDEYEALQKDLHSLFFIYVEKSRNLQWLESEMESHRREEQEELDETDRRMRRLQRRIHKEVLGFLSVSITWVVVYLIKCPGHGC